MMLSAEARLNGRPWLVEPEKNTVSTPPSRRWLRLSQAVNREILRLDRPAAVSQDSCAGDEGSVVRCQENHRLGALAGKRENGTRAGRREINVKRWIARDYIRKDTETFAHARGQRKRSSLPLRDC